MQTQHSIFGGILFQKWESILLLNHQIFVLSNKNEVLLIYCSFSFFQKDKRLKKLTVALKFLYFLAVLNLNSNLFWQFYLLVKIPLHCITSKRRNHAKPENLDTFSAVSIKNAQLVCQQIFFAFQILQQYIHIFQISMLKCVHCWK